MRHIIDQILNKQHLQAKDAIYEALAEIKTAKLQEVKKAIAATFSEASYGGSRNSFTRKNPVRADPDEMMKHIKARQEREDAERAEKKKKFLARKKAEEIAEGRLKDAAIEYEEKYGKKPEKTEDLGKPRKDKEADKKKKLHEVSKALLKRYIKDASKDAIDKAAHGGYNSPKSPSGPYGDKFPGKKVLNRERGISRAVDKLAKK